MNDERLDPILIIGCLILMALLLLWAAHPGWGF